MIWRPWTLMYVGAGISVIMCFTFLTVITTSGDASSEWAVWMFFGIGVALLVGGSIYEYMYKRKHGDERLQRYRRIVENED